MPAEPMWMELYVLNTPLVLSVWQFCTNLLSVSASHVYEDLLYVCLPPLQYTLHVVYDSYA